MIEQRKTIEDQGWSQIDANKNQSETLTAWTNKDDLEYKYKKIFEELVKERFAEKKLTNEINQNDLIYYFIGNIDKKYW